MKRAIFLSIVIALIIGGCADKRKSSIEGIWKLTYGKWYNWNPGDTIIYQFPGNMAIYHIKIFSKVNFTFVGHYSLDTLTHDNYGGGTYTIKGNRYLENVLYAGKMIMNRKNKMIQEIKNDTLIQKWPVDENWKLAEKYNIEKNIRLK